MNLTFFLLLGGAAIILLSIWSLVTWLVKLSESRLVSSVDRTHNGPYRPPFKGQAPDLCEVDSMTWYPCVCGAEHETPMCPFDADI